MQVRITSYNVCYTKLLRGLEALVKEREDLILARDRLLFDPASPVVTSRKQREADAKIRAKEKEIALYQKKGATVPARSAKVPRMIDAAKKYVVSSTLDRVDWNAQLVRGDLGKAVQQLKQESGQGLFVGGVKLALSLIV